MNEAVHAGMQTIFLRKGGIDESGFTLQSRDLILYPSFFHSDVDLLKVGMKERYHEAAKVDPKSSATLELKTFCRVTGAWATKDENVSAMTLPFHIGSEEFLTNRLKWRKGKPITVIEVRAFKLIEPIVIRTDPSQFGCFSWILISPSDILTGNLDLNNAIPSLPEAEFLNRQTELRLRLAEMTGVDDILKES